MKRHVTFSFLTVGSSSAATRGTISIKKSNMSDFDKAAAISDLCNVLLLFSTACFQASKVNSLIKMSHPFEKRIGAYNYLELVICPKTQTIS
jgi:hypothetical protein